MYLQDSRIYQEISHRCTMFFELNLGLVGIPKLLVVAAKYGNLTLMVQKRNSLMFRLPVLRMLVYLTAYRWTRIGRM